MAYLLNATLHTTHGQPDLPYQLELGDAIPGDFFESAGACLLLSMIELRRLFKIRPLEDEPVTKWLYWGVIMTSQITSLR